ncbi:MAG TPA: hypothetical protein VMR18_01990 [Candidatus Saccharimonadales bacterium]|jgi:hypothetical protein|nr:hypothetical protein [Candidatus Saccharimonadales bacterium]
MNEPPLTPPNIQELSTKSRARYQEIESQILPDNEGKFVAIEPETGEYEIGDTRETAVDKIRSKHGNKLVFVRKIGTVEKFQQHLSPLFNSEVGADARIF